MVPIDDQLAKRGFRFNGVSDNITHYVKDLQKGYIYIWVDDSKHTYSFTHNKNSIAIGAEHIFKKVNKFLQRLDETLAKI